MKHYTVTWSRGAGDKLRSRLDRGACMLDGVKTVTIFSDMKGVRSRIEPDGLAADWQKVGADLWAAIAAEKARREREAR